MRFVLSVSVLAAPFLLPLAAEDRVEELVKAAVVAAGGEEVLAKYPAGRVVGKGVMTFGGAETQFTFEQAFHVPGRFRTLVNCEVKSQKWEMLQVVNDGVAKQLINGRPVPLTDAAIKELQIAAILNEIGQLTPLATDRKFVIKHDKQVKGSDTAGLLVQVKTHPEIRLAFDRNAGHLVRIAYKGVDLETAKEAELETFFDEFKAVSGLTRPMRSTISRDGKKIVEFQIEKFTPLEKVDPKAFILDE